MRKRSVVRFGSSVVSLSAVLSMTPLALAEEEAAASAAESEPEVAVSTTAESKRQVAPSTAASGERHGSAFVDPLGFALFGPRIGVEAGAGHLSGALHARWFNGGLLSRKLFAKGDDELALGYGLGLRARYYIPEGLEGVHLGVAAEYLHSRVENQPNLLATKSSYFVPYAEAGYRLGAGCVYADLSAGVGYAFRMSSSVENLPGGNLASSYGVSDESSIYGTASLDLGIFF